MPAAKTFKCGLCNDPIGKTQGSIKCSMCESWLHLPCANVSEKHLALFKEKQTSFSFTCTTCLNTSKSDNSIREEVRALKSSLDDFIRTSREDRDSYRNTLTDILSDFKSETAACIKEMKADIVNCSKLINNIDASITEKIHALEVENNTLHRRLNRGDVVLSGLPSGLDDLTSTVISLCSFFDIVISDRDINQVFYMNNKRLILVKFNNISLRDRIMRCYFKTKNLRVYNVIGGDVSSRVYLNDHYSPAASNLNGLCRRLVRQKVILKFKILNSDRVKAKVTLPDGKEVVYDMGECTGLLNSFSAAAL